MKKVDYCSKWWDYAHLVIIIIIIIIIIFCL